jgi:hypothetical protein
MKLFVFILVSLVVGFIADILLNDLSNMTSTFSSLRPYYNHRSITLLATYSGLIIGFATLLLVGLFFMIYRKYLPTTLYELVIFFLIGYVLGFGLDVFIDKTNMFGNSLKPFYKEFGSGNSGAIAFIISLMVSLFIFKYILY